jgi:hypothetical protein
MALDASPRTNPQRAEYQPTASRRVPQHSSPQSDDAGGSPLPPHLSGGPSSAGRGHGSALTSRGGAAGSVIYNQLLQAADADAESPGLATIDGSLELAPPSSSQSDSPGSEVQRAAKLTAVPQWFDSPYRDGRESDDFAAVVRRPGR